jgi:hypothetical protein|tara:strand:+ start:333 stop:527 length:195 start_codon:yes stop_codon:yes gene_type:complete
MTQIEIYFMLLSFLLGATTVTLFNRRQFKNVYSQIEKLRGQVYYWSRQMPVTAKRGRPKKSKSV